MPRSSRSPFRFLEARIKALHDQAIAIKADAYRLRSLSTRARAGDREALAELAGLGLLPEGAPGLPATVPALAGSAPPSE